MAQGVGSWRPVDLRWPYIRLAFEEGRVTDVKVRLQDGQLYLPSVHQETASLENHIRIQSFGDQAIVAIACLFVRPFL